MVLIQFDENPLPPATASAKNLLCVLKRNVNQLKLNMLLTEYRQKHWYSFIVMRVYNEFEYAYAYAYVHVYIYIFVCMCVCMCKYTYIYMCVYMCKCIYINVCVYVYVNVYVI